MYWEGSFSSGARCSCVRVSAILLPPYGGFETEVVFVKLLHMRQLVFRKVRCPGGGGKLFELLLVIDVGKGRRDLRRGEDKLQGCLSQGAFPGLGEEVELLDLFESFEEPLLGAVAPVIVIGEGGLLGVLALQHTGGVGDADHEARVRLAGGLDEASTRVLFEEVVDHLQTIEV